MPQNRIFQQQIGQTPANRCSGQSALVTDFMRAPPGTIGNAFVLKWLVGTKVSRCYGCGGGIQNPPLNCPDDLVVMYRDIRQFRDRVTGQLTASAEPQNVHFHLRLACVQARYPHFMPACLHVSPDFVTKFRVEHLNRLLLEFGWTPGN